MQKRGDNEGLLTIINHALPWFETCENNHANLRKFIEGVDAASIWSHIPVLRLLFTWLTGPSGYAPSGEDLHAVAESSLIAAAYFNKPDVVTFLWDEARDSDGNHVLEEKHVKSAAFHAIRVRHQSLFLMLVENLKKEDGTPLLGHESLTELSKIVERECF